MSGKPRHAQCGFPLDKCRCPHKRQAVACAHCGGPRDSAMHSFSDSYLEAQGMYHEFVPNTAPPSAPVGVEEQPVAWTDADMEKPCGAEVAFLRRLSEAQWVPAEVGGMLRHSARLLEHRATELRSIYDLLNVETGADAGAEIARLHALAQQPAAVDGAMRAVAEALPPRPMEASAFGYQMSPLALTTLHDRFAALADALATQHQEPTT